ncbi:DUF6907 domain-containing protein [Polymorphospora rubra]|uniref:Uncharacterized protein n=1 Tax=Polymorphospora rubra TaxID=338584 RepID=A0A810N0A5_9ACTN|nr:hypothetical protein [Polymorphospora rubra]BCJ65078.1 hypothetical protein Prubr_20990 [Polymorphospora rubra]
MTAPALANLLPVTSDCPDWCDQTCDEFADDKGAFHTADPIRIEVMRRNPEKVAYVAVELCQYTGNDLPTDPKIEIFTDQAGALTGDSAAMTPAQARQVAAALIALADQAEGQAR